MMRLGEILDLEDGDRALGEREIGGVAFDSRKVRAGRRVLRAGRREGRRPEACRRSAVARRGRGCRSSASAAMRARRCPTAPRRSSRWRTPALRSPKAAATDFSATACDDRRCDRDERQDLGRGLRASDLGRTGPRGRPRLARLASSHARFTVYGSLTTPDPLTLHETLGQARGRRASRIWRDRSLVARPRPAAPRRRAARRRRIHQSDARPHGLSRDRGGLSGGQDAAVSASFCRKGAPAVIDADSEAGAEGDRRCAPSRRRSWSMTVGLEGR